jgi:hypothetical protein
MPMCNVERPQRIPITLAAVAGLGLAMAGRAGAGPIALAVDFGPDR